MGLGTLSELRVALLGVLLAAVVASYVYVHHEGYEACRAPQKAAEKAQVEKDLENAKGTIHDLQTKLAAIPAAQPPPHLILCNPPRSVRAGTATEGAQPAVAGTATESPDRVPTGATGLDIGQPVSDAERAAEIIAIFRDTTRDWALKQAKP